MKQLVVNKEFENKKLSIYLHHQFDGLSINTIYKALRKKDIIVNGTRINTNVILHENDNITIYIPDELLYKKIDIDIIYEDSNIVVVNKPIGIEVITGNPDEKSMTTFLKEYYKDISIEKDFPSPCHRIDRNTCGLVLFAKNDKSSNILLDKFKNQEIEKHYSCVVYGIPKKEQYILSAYLFKDTKKSLVYISDTPKKGYSKIVTSYTVLSKNKSNNTSVLDVQLHTGKTHQIRAHLAHIGLPIIGDGKYGINEINKQFNQKTQLLQSYMLKFNFKTDSGILEYLNGKSIKLQKNIF